MHGARRRENTHFCATVWLAAYSASHNCVRTKHFKCNFNLFYNFLGKVGQQLLIRVSPASKGARECEKKKMKSNGMANQFQVQQKNIKIKTERGGVNFEWEFKLFLPTKCNTNPQKWEIE